MRDDNIAAIVANVREAAGPEAARLAYRNGHATYRARVERAAAAGVTVTAMLDDIDSRRAASSDRAAGRARAAEIAARIRR